MASRFQRKNYRIDTTKLNRTRKILGTRTETETIHRALDLVADEVELAKALKDLVVKGRGQIEDIDADRSLSSTDDDQSTCVSRFLVSSSLRG
jgi:hypothetical protein